jgi:hypothetical protein
MKRAGFSSVDNSDPDGLYSGLNRLTPERQQLAKRQIKAIIESLSAEDEPDTDYITDT